MASAAHPRSLSQHRKTRPPPGSPAAASALAPLPPAPTPTPNQTEPQQRQAVAVQLLPPVGCSTAWVPYEWVLCARAPAPRPVPSPQQASLSSCWPCCHSQHLPPSPSPCSTAAALAPPPPPPRPPLRSPQQRSWRCEQRGAGSVPLPHPLRPQATGSLSRRLPRERARRQAAPAAGNGQRCGGAREGARMRVKVPYTVHLGASMHTKPA
jgi:hypothetical protein